MWGKWEPDSPLEGVQLCPAVMEINTRSLKKTKNVITICSTCMIHGHITAYTSTEIPALRSYSCALHSSKELAENGIHRHNGILFGR